MIAPLPRYVLYDEPASAGAAADLFIHGEPLHYRSRERNWTIRAHRHPDMHQIHLIAQGEGCFSTDAGPFSFAGPVALVTPRGAAHAIDFVPEATGWVITFAASQLVAIDPEGDLAGIFDGSRVVSLQDPDAALAASAAITREAGRYAPCAHRAAAAHLTLLLVEIARALAELSDAQAANMGRSANIVARFRAMVERQLRTGWTIAHYARELGVSQSRLRHACVEVTAKPPIRLLNEARIAEARRELIFGDRPAAAIAWDLGFEDPAYFSRVFTRIVGVSPGRFRREQHR